MSACEKCGDKGYWFEDNTMVVCTCQQRKLIDSKKLDNGITPKMARNRLESFDMTYYTQDRKKAAQNALHASRGFIENYLAGEQKDGLIFLGSVGSGKTYLASAIISSLIDSGVDAKLILLSDFLDELRAAMKDGSPQRIINQVKAYPVLAIDDLGADNNTDFAINSIFSLLNYRLNYELPTIITTNLSFQQIEEVYGSRICSRLTEMCRFYKLNGDGDIRIKKRLKARTINEYK